MSKPPVNVRFPGLTGDEVVASRKQYGVNLLRPPARDPWWVQWLSKFDDPVIRILIVAAGLQIVVGLYKGEYIEGIAIVLAILLATTLAFLNEYKASQEFDVLNQVNDDVPYKAIRQGEFVTVAKRDIVVGDVLVIETGEEIPADAEVLEGLSLSVSEASLTGEAVPVSKSPAGSQESHEGEELAYPRHRVYRGTLVADGYGLLRILAVGDATELGRLGQKASEQTEEVTPLNEQLDRLSKWIGVIGLSISMATFTALVTRGILREEFDLTGSQWWFAGISLLAAGVAFYRVWLKLLWDGFEAMRLAPELPEYLAEDTARRWALALGAGGLTLLLGAGLSVALGVLPAEPQAWFTTVAGEKLLNYFMIAVVIIVVAVPEGLAMSVTLSLAYSMRKMTRENTLVRKLHACETIGAATIICTDKTGTLTENKMTVQAVEVPGVQPQDLRNLASGSIASQLVDALAVNTTAQLSRERDQWKALGNPTEGALLIWLESQGVPYAQARSEFNLIARAPFTTLRKFMASAGTNRFGESVLHAKGAPERILEACTQEQTPQGPRPLSAARRGEILNSLKEYQARAMRTIGLGYRSWSGTGTSDLDHELQELTWLGYVAIADPVRPEVPPAVARCQAAGIGVKIVTGDTADTAREIGRQIGLIHGQEGPEAEMTGPEFEALSDAQASERAKSLKILARARPLDKLRLVRLLQDQREVVAVTGDGTNDAPALNYAKVGLAMGQTGTATAKEAADIVLLDDSFRSIVTAVKWGRGLYENIQRFLIFQLTINVVALGIALLGPFVGIDFPLTVMQMLWVNLIMDTFAALALATEPPREAVLARPPRRPEQFIVTRPMAIQIFGIGAIFLVSLLLMLLGMPHGPGGVPTEPLHETWLTIFFSVFVFLQFWNLFNARCLGSHESAFRGLFQNRAFLGIAGLILVGQILLVQFGGAVFRTVPLDALTWLIIIVGTFPVLLLGEAYRAYLRWTQPEATPAGTAS